MLDGWGELVVDDDGLRIGDWSTSWQALECYSVSDDVGVEPPYRSLLTLVVAGESLRVLIAPDHGRRVDDALSSRGVPRFVSSRTRPVEWTAAVLVVLALIVVVVLLTHA